MKKLASLALASLLTLSTPLAAPANNGERGHISLDVRNADIIDVLRLLATEADLSLLANDSVKHQKVTLHLHDVPLSQALETLADAYGLQIHRRGGVIIVCADAEPTTVLQLRYVRASDTIKELKLVAPSLLYSANDQTNTLLVTGNQDAVSQIRTLVSSLDRPTPQVMFEVHVADIITNNDNSNVGMIFGGLQAGTPTPGQFFYQVTPFIGKTIGVFAQLNAMVTNGNARILATPRIASLNNQEASILIGTQYPIVTTTATNGGSNVNVSYVDIGVKLRVTPTIGTDGSIIADLHPEVSTIDAIIQSAGASAPQISDRRIDATLRVRKDETIVLGGLLRDIDSNTITKLPFLGDIPVFGGVFKNRQHSRYKDEVVFLITPHIIQ